MPDGVVSPRDFVHMVDNDDNMHLSVTQGNTIIFDSYTPEHEVRRRNLKTNNVSKLNQMQNRFANDFNVKISSVSITAVLCSSTVANYRVVDKKSGQELTASDKRPEYIKAQQDAGGGAKRRKTTEDPQNPMMLQEQCYTPSSHCNMIIPALHAPQQSYQYFAPPPQQMGACGSFDRPGIPLFMSNPVAEEKEACECLVHFQKTSTKPVPRPSNYSIMSFTSSAPAPLLLPRRLEKNDVAIDEAARPFPFQHAKDHAAETLDPIFDEAALLQNGTSSSDNVRVAVPVSDLLRSGESDTVQAVSMSDSISDAATVLKELRNISTTTTTPSIHSH